MNHIEEIKAMGITTSYGSNLDDNDLIYIDDLYCAMEKVEHRFLVDETPSANANNEVIETSYTSRLVSKVNNFELLDRDQLIMSKTEYRF